MGWWPINKLLNKLEVLFISYVLVGDRGSTRMLELRPTRSAMMIPTELLTCGKKINTHIAPPLKYITHSKKLIHSTGTISVLLLL